MVTGPKWLEELDKLIPDILAVTAKCDTQFQQICFETLLERAMQEIQLSEEPIGGPKMQGLKPKGTRKPGKPFEIFCDNNQLASEEIEKIVDLDTGEIFIRNLGASKRADQQRTLACILAVSKLSQKGVTDFSNDELVKLCTDFACYDSKNFAANMNNLKHESSAVFVKSGNDWKVTPRGIEFIGFTVKKLVEPKKKTE